MKKIHVNTTNEYDVLVGDKILNQVGTLSRKVLQSEKVFIITDDTVNKLYGKEVANNLCMAGFDVYVYVTTPGEESKRIGVLYDVLEALSENYFKRTDAIVALGGGVIGDLAGLVAALYMRGIQYIQIPTTLLAMVDSSVGGKTAINLTTGKNLVGAFYQPSLVICDSFIAKKLPKKIFSEGMGEVAKYALITKNRISEYILSDTANDYLDQIIATCIKIKATIVSKDEFETKGERKLLNAGHTVAHAVETKSNHTIAHGEAVKIGLLYEAQYAYENKLCSKEVLDKIFSILKKVKIRKSAYTLSELVPYMLLDKKNAKNNEIVFVLPRAIGKYEVTSVCKEL